MEYSKQDIYKICYIVFHYPEEESYDREFWARMIKKYGCKFFGDRSKRSMTFKWYNIKSMVHFLDYNRLIMKRRVLKSI